MAAALVQFKTGTSTSANPTCAFDAATQSGNTVVLSYAADDYNASPDSGWTQSAEMEQQTFHGGYLWWRVSTGQTSYSYTIGSAVPSVWFLSEWSGLTGAPYDVSEGQFQQASANSYTTPAATPTAGDRLLLAVFGSSLSSGMTGGPTGWTDSFTQVGAPVFLAAAPGLAMGQGYRTVTANGSTAYSTGVNWGAQSPQSQSGMIIAFKVGAGGGSAPTNSVAPVVSGDIDPGDLLTTTNGTWTNSPTGYTYQWQRTGVNISGATSSTYTLQEADRGATVRCVVTASNGAGSNSANSNAITGAVYTNTVAPAITGTPHTGQVLSCSDGTWAPTTPTIITYRWKRNGANISGATANTYTLQVADEGQSIKCTVTATNSQAPAYDADSNTVTPNDGTTEDDIFVREAGEWVPTNKKVRASGQWV